MMDIHTTNKLQILKLGGSLITEKGIPHTARIEIIDRLAAEVSAVWHRNDSLQLILGHGSGSFGHVPASTFGTRQGVHNVGEWYGFISVWHEASELNRIVLEALISAGIPAISFPPSASIIADGGRIVSWDLGPIRNALSHHLLPVVYGDVVFDDTLGGTILSTEDLFGYLAIHFRPSRILLAGLEPGVWKDYPKKKNLLPEISLAQLKEMKLKLEKSENIDVTGGMESKITQAVDWVHMLPELEVLIFSGCIEGEIEAVLEGKITGTFIHI